MTPPSGRRAPATSADTTATAPNRGPWRPNNARTVLLSPCGHVELDAFTASIITKTINGRRKMVDAVYCQKCERWQSIERLATAFEAAGIHVPPQVSGGLFDEPPF